MSELLKKAEKVLKECFIYKGKTLAQWDKKCDKRDGITDHQKLKAEKLRRVGLYREQMQSNDEIEYVDINEHKLYTNQMNFAKYCPQIDLEEDE